jgi:8-oxo-dGTP pyrophosphatase MutT (NUDIX family)
MTISADTLKNFPLFKDLVRERLAARTVRSLENPGYVPAAVMILFMFKDGEAHVLLTRRSHKVKTHKGEMSLPGGGFDDSDEDILTTGYRETEEEVGIPREKIEYLGRFDDYFSIAGFHVAALVGAIEYPFRYTFNEDEIDGYVEAPISLFLERKYDRVQYVTFKGHEYKVYHYFYRDNEIWGLTARILTDFAEEILY